MRIIIQLAQTIMRETGVEVDDSFLDKLDEINTLESIIDILKFIESDTDGLLLQCPKI
jgi:hypothetical protein